MTVHPVRHSGMVLGVPQTLRYFEQMQERIVSFVAGHSGISATPKAVPAAAASSQLA